ncbi:Rap1 GTPase-GDP dissociation stimulator 1-B [Nymphon striatum]|nr:Rap1 GTPase-GDP dissociation stimulator 1-B [Nymphon striatum]
MSSFLVFSNLLSFDFTMEDCVKTLHQHNERSSTEVCSNLDTLLNILIDHNGDERKNCVEKLIQQSLPSALSSLLSTRQSQETDLHTKVAEVVAELAKTDIARESCVDAELIPHLLDVLDTNGSELTVQVCRALGNICYENDDARLSIVNEKGVSRLLELLRGLCRPLDPNSKINMNDLRSVATGFLLNLSNTHEESQGQLLDEGAIDILKNYLDQHNDEEVVTLHALLTLNCLCDSTAGREKITKKELLASIVNLLSRKISDDLLETVLELLSNIAENDDAKFQLTELGICEKMINLVQSYVKQPGEESDQVVKNLCDLLVIFLTGDAMVALLNRMSVFRQHNLVRLWVRAGVRDTTRTLLGEGVEAKEQCLEFFRFVSRGLPPHQREAHTDAMVALLNRMSVFRQHNLVRLWVRAGVRDTARYGPLHTLYELLGCQLSAILPTVHSLTGCNITGKVGIKKAALKAGPEKSLQNLGKFPTLVMPTIWNAEHKTMEYLYDSGNGTLYKEVIEWLKSPVDSLQVAGALAIGNFARSDEHCKMMVSSGLPKDLLKLLEAHSGIDGDIRLQHAVLSALRNLAVNSENKPALLKYKVIDFVMPMIIIETYPVVFKLLGLLRMLTDKQEETASRLGTDKALLTRLVEWCSIADHPGVQGESKRLLAWLIKNSKSAKVTDAVNDHDGLKYLILMMESEHAVMQNEAVLALILMFAHLKSGDGSLKSFMGKDANVVTSLHKLFSRQNCTPETLCNAITFVGQLASDADIKLKLQEDGVVADLKILSDKKETCLAASEVLHMFEKI